MARERWQIWRFCMVCNAKLMGNLESLNYGYQDKSSDDPKALHFYLTCEACGGINPLDASLIPGLVQEVTKKEFYRQRTKKQSKMV